jgi:hypothetical protein
MFDLSKVESENTGWKPLKAGLDVPAVLENVEYAKDQNDNLTQDLVFNFKGTQAGNTGTMNFRIWANTFNPQDQYYDQTGKKAERTAAQIKHILAAYLPEESVNAVSGANWQEFSKAVISALNGEVIKRQAMLKVVLDNKDRGTFPLFPDFIVTDLTPERSLSLNTKVNPVTGLPYERITPMEQPTAQAGGDAFGDAAAPDAMFGDAPAFGG